MPECAIRTVGLTRDFATVRAVDDLDLEVPVGALFGFLGPNGSGKTTTIRLLLGLLEPSAGRAEVMGLDTRREAQAIRQQSGALLEHHGLYERLTAADNLEFAGRAWRLPGAQRNARAEELLRAVDLWDRRHEAVEGWSRGMKQKLAIARALLPRPKLVFLDEPTAGLDPIAASTLRDALRALTTEAGVTVFLTTHNLAEAQKVCDVVAVIRAGRLLAVGKPSELGQSGAVRHVEVEGRGFTAELLARVRSDSRVRAIQATDGMLEADLADGVDPSELVALLVGAGASVNGVRAGTDLEETFVALVTNDSNAEPSNLQGASR